jgi:galactose mutarotase-like enzyme
MMVSNRYHIEQDGGIRLENEEISVIVYPRYGGKISSFCSRQGKREWFWRNPQTALKQVEFGSPYDDNFYGGMDELFPNDFPTVVNDVTLPDHGELWSQPWDYDIVCGEQGWTISMSLSLRLYSVRIERRIYLKRNGMVVESTLTNLSDRPFPYLWVLHPAFNIGPRFRFHFPQGKVIVDDELNGRVRKEIKPFTWPGNEIGYDLSVVPERNGGLESYYITDLPEGRFIIEDTENREALKVEFPLEVFPHMWLFMPLGGWRDHYVAVIEPSSGYPTDLAYAVKNGTSSNLQGNSSISAVIKFTAFSSGEIR